MAWQSRPIFVSSTFVDMQAERDHLRTHVFPALEERLRSRRCHLEWVDLRLGVAAASYQDAEMRELQVLKVCLGEVQRCRPFLIVLLGDRYGWVPPAERIAAAAREVGLDEGIAGRSVTELEIQFGVLSGAEHEPRSFFYFRESLPYAAMPPGIAAAYSDSCGTGPDAARRSERLTALKTQIEARLPDRVRRYTAGWDAERQCVTGLDAWGQTVLEDVWSQILATTAAPEAEAEISWQEAEHNALEDYIEDRTRDFLGRGEVLSRLQDLASSGAQEGDPWGLCLTAPPGSGKSAIFGAVHRRLRQNGVFVLAHAAAASARAGSVDDMLRRWIGELGAALGTDPELPDSADPDAIDAAFRALLARMAGERRVVVVVDGLDQFEATTRGRFATWLPRLWPANARLITTATRGEASTTLEARGGIETLALPQLSADEARRIAEAICARYHRTLEPEVLEALLAKRGEAGPAWGNTLWLVLAVEELNLVDGDDFGRASRSYAGSTAERLRALMLDIVADLPPDVLGLYSESFARAEKLFGAPLALAFLGLIAVGRGGWRESDFRVLLLRATGAEWDELQFASLRRLFRGQIRQRGAMGQWDFNHAQMRAAVRRHLAERRVAEARLHGLAAQHLLLSLTADDPLRQTETMVHLLGAGDWLLAAQFYGSKALSQPEFDGAMRVLVETIRIPGQAGEMSGLDQVLSILRAVSHRADNRAATLAGMIAIRLLPVNILLGRHGELTARAALLESIRKTFDWLVGATVNPEDTLPHLAFTHGAIGDVQVAQGALDAALDSYAASRSIRERLVQRDPGNAGWQGDLSTSHSHLGDLHAAQGNLDAAMNSYKASHTITERLVVRDPGDAQLLHELGISHNRIGDVHSTQGDLGAALASYEASRAIRERLAQADPREWQGSLRFAHDRIGNVHLRRRDFSAALASYERSHAITRRLADADPGNAHRLAELVASYSSLREAHRAQGNLEAAMACAKATDAIARPLAEADPSNAGWQRNLAITQDHIGDLHRALGNLDAALESFKATSSALQRLVKADPSNTGWQRDLSICYSRTGHLHRDRGDFAAALESHETSYAISKRLLDLDPENREWQRDLAMGLLDTGGARADLGRLEEAKDPFIRGRDIIARLQARTPGDARLLEDLSKFDSQIARLQQATAVPMSAEEEAQAQDAHQRHQVGVSQVNIADARHAEGDLAAALASYEKARDAFQQLTERDPGVIKWQRDLAAAHNNIAGIHTARSNLAEALRGYQTACAVFERLTERAPDNLEWQRDLGASLHNIGLLHRKQDNFRAAADSFRRACPVFQRLSEAEPGETGWQDYLGLAHYNLGLAEREIGRNDAALDAFKASLAIRTKLVAAAPSSPKWQGLLADANMGIAHTQYDLGDLDGALSSYEAAHRIMQRLADIQAIDDRLQNDLGVALLKIGKTYGARGNASAALRSRQAARSVFQRRADGDPGNPEGQYSLAQVDCDLGEQFREEGNIAAAIDSYEASRAVLQRLVSLDPKNASWQGSLAGALDYIGAMRAHQGDLAAGTDSFKAAASVREAIVALDPGNAEELSYFADTHRNIGSIQSAQGHRHAALGSYNTALWIRKRAVAADPGNGKWRRHLVDMHKDIGDFHRGGRDVAVALDSYKASLAVAEQLVEIDPGNSEWQRVLGTILATVATVQSELGEDREALRSSERVRDILLWLIARSPGDSKLSESLAGVEGEIVKLEQTIAVKGFNSQPGNAGLDEYERLKAFEATNFKTGDTYMQQGEFARALAAYQIALKVANRFAADNPENAILQGSLFTAHDKLGGAYRALGDLPAALKSYQACNGTLEWFIKSFPGDATWPGILIQSHVRIAELHERLRDQPAARAAYQSAHDLIGAQSENDSLNAEAQYNMSGLQEKIGDTHYAQGDWDRALIAYRASQGLRHRLIQLHAASAATLRNLAALYGKIGDMHLDSRILPDALIAYQAAQEAFERLRAIDANNDGWQRDSALNVGRMGTIRKLQGAYPDARGLFRQARDMIAKLKARSPEEAVVLSDDAAWFDDAISALE